MSKVKPITLHMNDGKTFTLEFNRESIKFAESRGFSIADVDRYPLSKVYELFFYAFRMHHRNVSKQQTDKIIDDEWGGVSGIPEAIMQRLGELYAVPFGTLVPDEDEPKNSIMTVDL